MEPADSRVRILIVDDHQIVAQGLRLLLWDDADLEVVGIAATGGEGVEMAVRLQPDVVLVDFHLPDRAGADAAVMLKRLCPQARVVFLSADASPGAVRTATDAGASGYLVKDEAGAGLPEAVRRVAKGEQMLPTFPEPLTLADP
ncbi:MAG: response regulator transcription factor [Candidatus Dormiibacterota bacterium]